MKQTLEMDYGWNAVNFKRVAHGNIQNVEIVNFTNPLYLLDSRNVTVEHILLRGYDGHQGIKLYGHACDNLLRDIVFRCEYADMMGGEGNAYGNVFSDVHYLNSQFKPCDYDFHGFSEGPMSPPAYNLFENVSGFRYIKMAGAIYNQPACAQWNIWWNCISEGERRGDYLFHSVHYKERIPVSRRLNVMLRCLPMLHPKRVVKEYYKRMDAQRKLCLPKQDVCLLFKNAWIFGMKSTFVVQNNKHVHMLHHGNTCQPKSLFDRK